VRCVCVCVCVPHAHVCRPAQKMYSSVAVHFLYEVLPLADLATQFVVDNDDVMVSVAEGLGKALLQRLWGAMGVGEHRFLPANATRFGASPAEAWRGGGEGGARYGDA
jgi:hypothetical protein